jgi:hypothetical protein
MDVNNIFVNFQHQERNCMWFTLSVHNYNVLVYLYTSCGVAACGLIFMM